MRDSISQIQDSYSLEQHSSLMDPYDLNKITLYGMLTFKPFETSKTSKNLTFV